MKDCIMIMAKAIKLGQTPKGKRATYHYLHANNYINVLNKDHTGGAPCVWVSTYDKDHYLQYEHHTTYTEDYDDNNVLICKTLKDIPDEYYETMSVPITWGHYKWDDIEYLSTENPTKNGVSMFNRYYVKRKKI